MGGGGVSKNHVEVKGGVSKNQAWHILHCTSPHLPINNDQSLRHFQFFNIKFYLHTPGTCKLKFYCLVFVNIKLYATLKQIIVIKLTDGFCHISKIRFDKIIQLRF